MRNILPWPGPQLVEAEAKQLLQYDRQGGRGWTAGKPRFVGAGVSFRRAGTPVPVTGYSNRL